MLHERLYFKENNSKACNGMPKYNIMFQLKHIYFLCILQYRKEGEHTSFLAKRCGPAIEKLCRSHLAINTPSGLSVSVLYSSHAKYNSSFWCDQWHSDSNPQATHLT
jgi:hypothetical protein